MRRRLAVIVPVLALGLLTGCAQAAQFAGEAAGVPVDELCTSFDQAYSGYEDLLAQGDATAGQLDASREAFVGSLEKVADGLGGQAGDLIRTNARRLAESADLQAPESVELIEQLRSSVSVVCG